ncbi:MAG: dTDP-4-dehydrorhamnose 3,5-epimerase family protein [Pseudomonadota bacterium]
MSHIVILDTPLTGLKIIRRTTLADSRGFLSRLFCMEALAPAGWVKPIVQINHTCTRHAGTVRGMHYQEGAHAEMKLVSCLAGAVWDVAVDLRHGSPTFLRWHGVELSPDNDCALLIPEGFAHGFQALTGDVSLHYCHSATYAPAAERGLHPQDGRLAIRWPLSVAGLSVRDAGQPSIDAHFKGVYL